LGGLWCLTPLLPILQLYRGVSFISRGNRRIRKKPPTCRKSLTNFYHIMLYRVHLVWMGFEITTLMVISADCIGSYFLCKYPKKKYFQILYFLYLIWIQSKHMSHEHSINRLNRKIVINIFDSYTWKSMIIR